MTRTCFFCSSALANAASARRLSSLQKIPGLLNMSHRRQQLAQAVMCCMRRTGSLQRQTAVHHQRLQSARQTRRGRH